MGEYFLVCYEDYDYAFVLSVHTSLKKAEECRDEFRDAIRGYRGKALEVGAKSEWDIYEWMRDNVKEEPFDFASMDEAWRVSIIGYDENLKCYMKDMG